MPNSQQFAERMRAHARLFRQIAEETWSESAVAELVRRAEECERAAEAIAKTEKPDAA